MFASVRIHYNSENTLVAMSEEGEFAWVCEFQPVEALQARFLDPDLNLSNFRIEAGISP